VEPPRKGESEMKNTGELIKKAINKLIELQNCEAEEAHIEADKILRKVLWSLGYRKLVEEYKKIRKWYS
jgi:predicted GNAT family N-acyltransferase